ncbi:RNA-binding S4 domain-containing protein [Roseovarius aestuarii]|uniref:Heat shock protein 15 n=1 Tax=Roseovarius aestuarii TaxID=475083 RepID=A0A1X7BKU6_9RHOB|nr:RNA-binding S4 domain-containing protein [Roseovarius aestuarii]SMC10277.1 Heat shock protein 15 [Roseovarius aestuarii]
MSAASEKIRLDKWLWQARFFKTRSLAAKVASAGHVRVNGERVGKSAHQVLVGDVLTFPQARVIRVVRIAGLGVRRGPASEAKTLYEDLTPPTENESSQEILPPAPKFEGKGRPTKRDRRKLDLNKRDTLD